MYVCVMRVICSVKVKTKREEMRVKEEDFFQICDCLVFLRTVLE